MLKKIFTEIPRIGTGEITLGKITMSDEDSLKKMTDNPNVYKFLPVFLFEKKYDDKKFVIDNMYNEKLNDSLILGIFFKGVFCGLAEIYGFRDDAHKVSVGCRLMEEWQGHGIVPEVLRLMIDWFYNETDIEIITASVLPENSASERVLEKAGFTLEERNASEDWGYDRPLPTDKWIKIIRKV